MGPRPLRRRPTLRIKHDVRLVTLANHGELFRRKRRRRLPFQYRCLAQVFLVAGAAFCSAVRPSRRMAATPRRVTTQDPRTADRIANRMSSPGRSMPPNDQGPCSAARSEWAFRRRTESYRLRRASVALPVGPRGCVAVPDVHSESPRTARLPSIDMQSFANVLNLCTTLNGTGGRSVFDSLECDVFRDVNLGCGERERQPRPLEQLSEVALDLNPAPH